MPKKVKEGIEKVKGGDPDTLEGSMRGFMSLIDEMQGITPTMRVAKNRQELADFIRKMRGKNFTKQEIEMVRNYADMYSMNLAKEKLAPAIVKTKQMGGKGKAQIELTEDYMDSLKTFNQDKFLEYNTVRQVNHGIRESMLKDLRAQGLTDDVIQQVDDEIYQLSHDRTGGPFGGTTTASHPANWAKRAGDEIEMITGKKFDTKFYENYGNEVLSQYKKKPEFAAGGVAGQLHLYDGGRASFVKGKIVKGLAEGAGWFIKNFKSLIDEAANPGPWSRFSKMGAKDKQAAIADAKEMIKNLEAGDPIPEYLLEDIVANPKFTLKRSKATDPDLAEVENLAEGYNRLKNARANKFRGEIKLSPNDPSGAYSRNTSSALDDYELFTPTTTDMFGKPWKGKKNWIKEERAKIKKTQEEIGPAPSSRHENYRHMLQLRKGLEDRLTALDITEELGGNIKMYDKLRMHNYPTYKNTLDKRDWLMPPGGLKRREAFVIDLGHETLPPKKAEGGRVSYTKGGLAHVLGV